jgi:hypothetical protein
MARPSNAQRKLVELYVNGPAHLKGSWHKCAIAAGYDEAPEQDEIMHRMVEKAGGILLADAELDELAYVLQAGEDGSIPWGELRSKLASVIQSVANGQVKASAAQVSMLKFVIERAEKQASDDDTSSNVIVLPTQGTEGHLRIDDRWRKQLGLNEFANVPGEPA